MFSFNEGKPAWARNISASDPLVPRRFVDEYVANTRTDLSPDERVALADRAWPILAPMPFPRYGPGWWGEVTAQVGAAVAKAAG